jgi:hypothetical protein
VNGVQRRRAAAVLLILSWVLRLHPWIPALLVGMFVSWVLLHTRLEGDLGGALVRVWRRAWPPGTVVLMLLLSGSTFVFWVSDVSITVKVLPVALGVCGLATILLGPAWTLCADAQRLWRARNESALAADRRPGSLRTGERG